MISLLYDFLGETGDDGNLASDPLQRIDIPNEINAKKENVDARMDISQEKELKEGCNVEILQEQNSQGGKKLHNTILIESLLQPEEIQDGPINSTASMDIVKNETDPLTIANEDYSKKIISSLNSFSVLTKASAMEEDHQCDICDKRFTNVRQLSLHETVIHYGGHKPRECNICGKTFPKPYRLVEHMKIHSNEKPYKCNVCGKAYAQKPGLRAHAKLHATDVQEVKCQFCDLPLKNLMHKKLHSEKSPYKCNVCLEVFDCSGLLGTHVKTHNS